MRKKVFISLLFILLFSACATVENSSNNTSNNIETSNSGENYYSSAIAYLGIKNYELAKINFLKAIQYHYNLVGSYYYLGLIEYSQNNLELAEKYLLKCLKLNDKITDAHNTLGAIYAKKKQYRKAIEEFKKVLKDTSYLFPENALYNLALLHYNLKEYDESIKYCKKCLFIVPKSPAVYYLMGLDYYNKKNIQQARYYMMQIVREFPDNIWGSKAKIFLKEKKLW